MPHVKVKFFATVREVTGIRAIDLEANTIREVVDKLIDQYGKKFIETVINEETMELKRFFSCMVNGKRIELLDGYDTKLADGDAIALFPPVGGG